MENYRSELKYCSSETDLVLLESRLNSVLQKDSHSGVNGKYQIHSMYFDDYRDTCARANDSGCAKRFKWRIRYYENDLDTLRLELKEKFFNKCHKSSCALSLNEYNDILNGCCSKVFWNTNKTLLKKFCSDILTRNFTPKVIIDYERIAFVEPITNIRITLDTNISASNNFSNFLTQNYLHYPLLDKQIHVLEIKFDSILPGYIKNIVSSFNFNQIAFSKYYFGRKKLEEVIL